MYLNNYNHVLIRRSIAKQFKWKKFPLHWQVKPLSQSQIHYQLHSNRRIMKYLIRTVCLYGSRWKLSRNSKSVRKYLCNDRFSEQLQISQRPTLCVRHSSPVAGSKFPGNSLCNWLENYCTVQRHSFPMQAADKRCPPKQFRSGLRLWKCSSIYSFTCVIIICKELLVYVSIMWNTLCVGSETAIFQLSNIHRPCV